MRTGTFGTRDGMARLYGGSCLLAIVAILGRQLWLGLL
jgi:hypothetical protein